MLKGRRGSLRIGKDDLALELGVEQVGIAVDLDVADEVGVDHDDGGHAVKAGEVAFHVAVLLIEGVLIGAGVILEILAAVFHGADGAGPENIALGIFAFGGDALKGVARAHGEALGLDAGIGLKHGQHVFNHGSGQRAVQNQLAGFLGSGFGGGAGHTQGHDGTKEQGKQLLHG